MCGVIGILADYEVVHDLYVGLITLQHRGQTSAGIVTYDTTFHLKKGNGLASVVFNEKNLSRLRGKIGIGQVRYPTIGLGGEEDAQPFMVNVPLGIAMAHNGNVTNYWELREELTTKCFRHLISYSDVEVILNVFADELTILPLHNFSFEMIVKATQGVFNRVEGSYSVVGFIAQQGLFAFRDPLGIKPLCLGENKNNYIVASESAAIEHLGYKFVRDILPGEIVFIDNKRRFYSKVIETQMATPCIFEWVYFARPDSILDGIEVYSARERLGEKLGLACLKANLKPDVVIPVPDSGRGAAQAVARILGVPQKEGLIKNYYIGRTFIMPKQSQRKNLVTLKLNVVKSVIAGKKVLVVDDSIVRGTTAQQIVGLLRKAEASKVYYGVTCPPIKYPCVYGIDMMTRGEFVARNRSIETIRRKIGADILIYQTLEDMCEAVKGDAKIKKFCTACYTGTYPTGISKKEILKLEKERLKALNRKRGIS
ncbi:MAG: amidophosphoribosyltransferase [candidate division WOR-3 bacterium]|nr:amidophosphoribosyltransferase [candidate division WOR-3 bacterium]MCX7757027.1 amidophosphoribosyltransferase [candidate division WOR-3 bacterium]MDW7987331.1 amidophosphoribosyltransferase [candidate division WOR-3 bacterium]